MSGFIYRNFVVVLPSLTITGILLFFYAYLRRDLLYKYPALAPQGTDNPVLPGSASGRSYRSFKYHQLVRRDRLYMLIITAVYALTAFVNLGSLTAPQSFYGFTQENDSVVIDLGAEKTLVSLAHYAGNFHDEDGYLAEYSADGAEWVELARLEQDYSSTFRWHFTELEEPVTGVRYLRISAPTTPMELGELQLYDDSGNAVSAPPQESCPALFDEQNTVPEYYSYYNSTYFDEIYHARTAYEFIHGQYPYENTHPPLGKILIGVGIGIFGMNPFGWRFVGTLFGVLMVPIMYLFIKNLFGKTPVAVMGSLFFAFDFMHFTQTRIATIDTYGVFFTITAYYCMYRFIAARMEEGGRKQLLFLALSGISFGLGIASKWTVFYAAAGLAIIYAIYVVGEGRRLCGSGKTRVFLRRFAAVLAVSVLFFVLLPAAIYCLSYIPFLRSSGLSLTLKNVWNCQVSMFNYHKGVNAEHAYASRWWQWLFDIRPILYFLRYPNYPSLSPRSSFGAWLNPVVCWAGLGAVLSIIYTALRRRCDKTGLFILIGYLAQLVPWMFITRITFAYHYFPSMVFLVLALCWVIDRFIDYSADTHSASDGLRASNGLRTARALCIASVTLFVLFYPALSGLTIPARYGDLFLGWFPSWPF